MYSFSTLLCHRDIKVKMFVHHKFYGVHFELYGVQFWERDCAVWAEEVTYRVLK